MGKKLSNAVMVTGAAARISQEVASIDVLREQGLVINEDSTMLAGFSSGSLNLLAMNACFRNDNPLNWDTDYKQNTLWSLTDAKVYTKYPGIHIPIFDTTPLRGTLNTFLGKMGAVNFGDLAFDSFVMTFSGLKLKTEWANTFQEVNQKDLIASDLFMASTAIPIAFPKQEIGVKPGGERNFPGGHFRDGGTTGQFKNFEDHIGQYVLDNGSFETLHIISPMREAGDAEIAKLHEGLGHESLKELEKAELGKFAASISFKAFMKFLVAIQAWQKANNTVLAKEILICIPKMKSNFGILDFNQEEAQYNAVRDWIKANPSEFAVPLDTFVANHS
jgi:predicted acylesterase/phospholipase RssA